MYTTGDRLKVSLFGKSHADRIGCVIEGLPLGMHIDIDDIKRSMDLRRPSDRIGTLRKETDDVIFDSGISDDVVTSRYVILTIRNENRDPTSYSEFNRKPRPGHADLPALIRFKGMDISGGAQFSGRMTAPLVAAGAIASQYLRAKGIGIAAYTKQISDIKDENEHTFDEVYASRSFVTRSISKEYDSMMTERILSASEDGDSVGGVVGCMVKGLPIGFGGIWFDALDVTIAKMMFSIPGVKGVEFGKGFSIAEMKGSESNDQYHMIDGKISASSNNMGGVCGGMSDGMPLTFNVAFKPTPSISKEQHTIDLHEMKDTTISIKGRHDPCIVPRAVAVVEAMTAIAIMDQYLSHHPGE